MRSSGNACGFDTAFGRIACFYVRSIFLPVSGIRHVDDVSIVSVTIEASGVRQRRDALNLMALALIQGSNALVPLLIFPIALLRVGAEGFAQIVFAEAVSVMALIVCIYSYEIQGVIKVARFGEEPNAERIAGVYSEILFSRLILFGVCAVALLTVCLVVNPEMLLMLASFMLVPLGYVLQSTWLYQATEKNAPLSIVCVLTRAASVLIVYLFLREQSDALIVPLAIGSGAVACGILSMLYIRFGMGLKICKPTRSELANSIRGGRAIFAGNIFVAMYRDSYVLLLGALGMSGVVVSTYAMAEKLVKCIQAMVRPINQLFFPKTLRTLVDVRQPNVLVLTRVWGLVWPQMLIVFSGALAGLFIYWVYRDHVSILSDMPNRAQIETLVVTMLAAVFIGVANFMYGAVTLNALHEEYYFSRSLLIAGVAGITACVSLAPSLGSLGAAIAFVLSECVLLAQVLLRFGWSSR